MRIFKRKIIITECIQFTFPLNATTTEMSDFVFNGTVPKDVIVEEDDEEDTTGDNK